MAINKVLYNREIPDHIGFIILMIAGLLIALITIKIGDKIIQSAPTSKVFSGNPQVQQELNYIN